MNHRLIRHLVLIGAACIAFASVCAPARAQMIVYDPSNYAQNVLQAARALQQINNQITSLQNQSQMLLNQAKNLASLPYSSLQTIDQSFSRTQQLLNDAQRLTYDVNQIDQAFQRLYPQGYTGAASSQQLVRDAQERWQNARAGYQDALRVQAGAVDNLDTTRTEIDALVSASQSAVGGLQAVQASRSPFNSMRSKAQKNTLSSCWRCNERRGLCRQTSAPRDNGQQTSPRVRSPS